MSERPIVHPAFLQRAIDAEAELWAGRTALQDWVDRFSSDPRTRGKLSEIAKQCFGEGFYEGIMAVKSGKTLNASLDEREDSPHA